MKLLIPLLAVGLLLIAGCSEDTPFQTTISDSALDPIIDIGISNSNHVMVPFRGEYDETFVFVPPFPPPIVNLELSGVGFATHLGNSTFIGTAHIVEETGADTGTFLFTAANGDELAMSFVAVAFPPDAMGIATFSGAWTVTGGSGRFKDTTGTGTVDGFANVSDGTGHLILEGEISQPTGRKRGMDGIL